MAEGQTGNPCGVVASMWPPASDSVVIAGTIIPFTSTSTNGTSFQWLLEGFFSGTTGPLFNLQLRAGVHTISLVASNGICSDTTTVIYFAPGKAYNVDTMMVANYGSSHINEEPRSIRSTADGGFIMAGIQHLWQECGVAGIVVKMSEKGCIEWSKKILASTYCNNSSITNLHASADSSYYVVTNELDLMKLDKLGNLEWYKRFSHLGNAFGISYITGDETGAVYILSPAYNNGWCITKINKDAVVIWNKIFRLSYQEPGSGVEFASPRSILYNNNKIYVCGNAFGSPDSTYFSFLTKLDAITGEKEWQYGYIDHEYPTASGFVHLSMYDTLLMVSSGGNGHLVTLIDPQGNNRKSFKTQFKASYAPRETRARADSNGRIYLMQWTETSLPLQPYYAYATNFAEIDTSLNKYWGMTAETYSRSYYNDATMNKDQKFIAIGQEFGYVDNGSFGSRDMRVIKIDSLRSNLSCYDVVPFSLLQKTVKKINFEYIVDTSITLIPSPSVPHSTVDAYIQSRYVCPDFIDSCSFMKISGIKNLCDYNNIYTYKIHRNKKCALVPQWKLPAGVSIITQTDSSISLKFSAFGDYRIAASLNSCIPVKDSLLVRIVSKSGILNIGADTSICPGSSIRLRAANNFFSYRWNDNSTDSLLQVNLPGIYWVETIDSCNNPQRDSILISPYNNSIFIGPDRIICANDTVHLTAPGGFSNYQWSNNYNISATGAQNVVVRPTLDTSYFLRAEKLPGCYAYDTVRIKVNTAPLIALGADKSFCLGDSASLSAGNGFDRYLWNNGNTSQQITVFKTGTFSVMAVTAEGCKASDTLSVINVWDLPLVSLDKTPGLCINSTRILNAGNFVSFLWQDGSNSGSFAASSPGTYFVTVKDIHQCTGSDTVRIIYTFPRPSDFLSSDTAICNYGEIVLQPTQNFKSYLWSNGSLSRSLLIKHPGIYSLKVTDDNNCFGTDSVTIHPKQCMEGVYIPSAFTPNNDGENDLFRPMIFGNIQQFEFTVLNRYGQPVFRSNDPLAGWDGRFKGLLQDTGTYIWVCRYGLNNQPLQIEKGFVILVR